MCERSACEYVNITLTNRWCAEHALRHNERHRFVYNTFCHFFNKMRTYTIISSPFWGTAVNCGHTERNVPDHSVRTRIAVVVMIVVMVVRRSDVVTLVEYVGRRLARSM